MLFSLLRESAVRGADRVALETRDGPFTYGQLHDISSRMAAALAAGGIERGLRLLIASDDPAFFVPCFFAAVSLGAVVVVTESTSAESTEAAGLGDDADCVVVAAGRPAERWQVQAEEYPAIVEIEPGCVAGQRPMGRRLRQSGPAVRCSGIERTHVNLVHEARGLAERLKLRSDDRLVSTLGPSCGPGLSVGLLAAVRAGAAVAFVSGQCLCRPRGALAKLRPSILLCTHAELAAMTAEGPANLHWPESMRCLIVPCGAEPEQMAGMRARVPVPVVTFYYRVEAGTIAVNWCCRSPGSIGRPLRGLEVYLENRALSEPPTSATRRSFGSYLAYEQWPNWQGQGPSRVREPGLPGWIVVEGPNTAPAVVRQGRFRTDDRGYLDADGELCLLPADRTSPRSARPPGIVHHPHWPFSLHHGLERQRSLGDKRSETEAL